MDILGGFAFGIKNQIVYFSSLYPEVDIWCIQTSYCYFLEAYGEYPEFLLAFPVVYNLENETDWNNE